MKRIRKIDGHTKARIYFALSLAVLILGMIFYVPAKDEARLSNVKDISYVDLKNDLEKNAVDSIYYSANSESNTVYVCTVENEYYKIAKPGYDEFEKMLYESGVIIKPLSDIHFAEQTESKRFGSVLFLSMVFVWCAFICKCKENWTSKSFQGSMTGGRSMVVGLDNSSMGEGSKAGASLKTFADVAGLKEVKKDMACIVDFLVNKEAYADAGAKLPKGIILYGPPGTGKTLLAKAVAGEAKVPFFYMSGSEFVELYVGVGAKRVRELFAKARKQSPCIVFIDEIDAIGCSRDNNGMHSEDRKTLNALLTEMDGFKETENIIVIGATNRMEDLDPALTRPGRFTNKYCVPLPETVSERLEIINLYVKNKRIDESVDLDSLARETVGFSPARIEALLNEASIVSVQEGSHYITKEILDKAMYKLLLQGHMKEDVSERDEEELRVVAWHEAGHAVLGYLFGNEVNKVTVIPSTSGAGGVTFSTPAKTTLLSVNDLEHEVMELYGGRLAELIYYKGDKHQITTGASNDIERATALIHDIVTRYGMSEQFGMLNLTQAQLDNKDIVSCEVALAKKLEKEAYNLLTEHKETLSKLADLLIANNTIYSSDIKRMFKIAA